MTRRPTDAYRPDMRNGRDADSAINRLKDFADVLMPGEAEEPILSPPVRAAVFEWLAEVRAAEELAAVACKPRRTALLFGPPGCGKTTLAHHFAARLGLPLACVRSESLISSYLGSTGQNIGKLFDAMKASEGHVVVFFDEVDALGGRRMNDQGASVERANSLNVLLRRIETFQGISLAATNRQDFLDPALWRRFGMQISVDLPGHDERFAIIRRYAAPFKAGAFACASLGRLDTVASAMERRWGVDRLPKLVDAALAVRFSSQRDRLDDAIRADRPELISVQAEAMIRAWQSLDAEATKACAPPLAPTVWELVLPTSGEVVAIVRDSEEALAAAKDRKGAVWTLPEVAVAIEAFGEQVRAAKAAFPGAEVTAVHPTTSTPALNIGSAKQDAAADSRKESTRPRTARTPKRQSAGYSGLYGPLPHQPLASSTKPPVDWARGDDIPF